MVNNDDAGDVDDNDDNEISDDNEIIMILIWMIIMMQIKMIT